MIDNRIRVGRTRRVGSERTRVINIRIRMRTMCAIR